MTQTFMVPSDGLLGGEVTTRVFEDMPDKYHIIQMSCGLGNQMFQYAFGCAQEARGATVEYDLAWFSEPPPDLPREKCCSPRTFDLHTAFDFSLPLAAPRQVDRLGDMRKTRFARKRRHYLGLRKTHVQEAHLGDFIFHPEVWEMSDRYFQGSWQNPRYFADIAPVLRKAFDFSPPVDANNLMLLDQIHNTNSVGIHIRRGDFLNFPHVFPVQTAAYYQQALAWMAGQTGALTTFVFGDDIPWAREILHLENAVYVDWNRGENAFRDMQLLSQCHHLVIANSSFSWWADWLNTTPGKTVVAPAIWMHGHDTLDLYNPAWHVQTS